MSYPLAVKKTYSRTAASSSTLSTPTGKNAQASSKGKSCTDAKESSKGKARAVAQESSKGKGRAEAEDIDGDWYMV